MNLFLEKLSQEYPDEPITLVVDGDGWHRSQKLHSPNDIDELVFLPPIAQSSTLLNVSGFRQASDNSTPFENPFGEVKCQEIWARKDRSVLFVHMGRPSTKLTPQVTKKVAFRKRSNISPCHFVEELLPLGGFSCRINGRFREMFQNFSQSVVPVREKLICVEMDPKLCGYLKKKFPNITVICGNACHLSHLIPAPLLGSISAVVSGIPMITFLKKASWQIVNECFSVIKKGDRLLQVTYTPFSSIQTREHHRLQQTKVKTVFRNVPPATVWDYKQN